MSGITDIYYRIRNPGFAGSSLSWIQISAVPQSLLSLPDPTLENIDKSSLGLPPLVEKVW